MFQGEMTKVEEMKKMKQQRRTVIGILLAASLAQGLIYPTMAYGLDAEVPDPITDSSVTYHDDGSVRVQNAPDDANEANRTDGSADDAADGDILGEESTPTPAPASPDANTGADEGTQDALTEDSTDRSAAQAPVQQESGQNEDTHNETAGVRPPSEDYTGRITYQGAVYYFEQGQMVKDAEVYESGNWYMYDADGRMVTNREIPVRVSTGRTKLVRYDADGKMHKGVYTENGKRYFYDKVTGGRVSGVWRMLNEDGQGTRWVYYSTADGTMQFGEQYLNYDREHTGWYYFDTRTGKMAHGVIWVNSSGGKWVYYHIKNGKMQYGQQYLNYDREHTGWYYFDTCTGKMAHGFTSLPASGKDAAKTVYYHAQSGKMQYGGHLINNRPYYFDKNTGRKYSGTEVVNTLVRTARNYCHSNLNASNALVSAGGIFCPKGPCMSFVWCVYHYSGMDVFLANGTSAAGRPSGYPDDYYNWYARNGRLTRTPRVGDIAFFYFSSGAGWATNASHAALVVGVNGSKVTVIDAAFYNIAERVASNSGGTYPLPKAYGHPDFQ